MRRIALATAGTALVVWVFYLGVTWGPRPIDAGPVKRSGPASPELVEESRRLAREFEAIAALRDPTAADLELLRDALSKQREYNLAQPPSREDRLRQDELERRLVHFQAKEIHDASLEAEQEAERLLAAGEATKAVESMQRAFDLQRTVNQTFGRSAFRDVVRESHLEKQMISMEAEPLHQRSVELEQRAEEAIEAFRWSEAREYLTEARRLQGRINDSARRSSFYNTARYQRLGERMAQLEVGEMMSEVLSLQKQGEEEEKNGRWESAAQTYERAMVLQNQINRDHPQSRFVSVERVSELDVARQTALSGRQAEALKKAMTELRGAVAAGNFAGLGEKIGTASQIATQLFDRFPQSKHADFGVRLEIEYLDLVQASLPELQQLLRAELLPIPGLQDWQMSSTLVSQRLYSRVMSANPSRNLGEDLPVDSVTLSQARDFCRRASWILARPVQLPERSQFEAALGEWNPETYAPLSWHKENSGGKSHPVTTGTPNANGFFDLVGNVRLWLGETAEDGSAWTAGVSYAEELPEEDLFQLTSSNRREPTIGFRYVVGAASL